MAINRYGTNVEKACVLAEGLGHYYTTVGNILNQSSTANHKQEIHITLAITSGKKSLHMGMLASTITMRQNADGYIYFDTMPEEIFTLNDYSWEGPRYKNVTTTQEKGKYKDKTKRKGGLGAAAVGTLLMPGVGTAIGYATGSKKVTKGKHTNNVVTDENQEEIDGTASIQLKNVKTGETFSFGFVCNTKINVELDAFDWNNLPESQEQITQNVQSESDKIKLLKQYKDLLDSGIISQDEFNQKKRELLG